jgi:hypothetical protein
MNSAVLCYLFCCFLIVSAVVPAGAQSTPKPTKASGEVFKVAAQVDTRVELLSIVARLAGYQEYKNDFVKSYADDVDRHFARYKEHPAIQYAVKVRGSHHIGYDAVMSMAVHLNPPPKLTPRVGFTEKTPDTRWRKEGAEEFVRLLQQFYKDADCERFFQSHTDLYRTAEGRYQQLLKKVDFDWYRRFYGEVPKGSFNLYIGLLNGGGNYGPKVVHPNGTEDLYAIMGTWKVDDAGLPVYDDSNLQTIIHEFNHSFINHLVFAHESQLKTAGEKIFPPVAEKLRQWAYGTWQTAFLESLVRAAVIRYVLEHESPQVAYKVVQEERNRGFLWMGDLFPLLGVYENSRKTYPTFRSFFPLIVGYFQDLAGRMDYEAKRFEELSPHVAALSPFANEAQDVDPSLTELTVTFDRPLDPKAGYSINWGPGGGEHFPIGKEIRFSEDGKTLTLPVTLKPDWEYAFVLTGRAFKTKDGYPLQPYTVKFRTKKP